MVGVGLAPERWLFSDPHLNRATPPLAALRASDCVLFGGRWCCGGVGFCSDVLVIMLAAADLFLWRNKRISGGVLAGATAI
jgi:hypothetical protein